MLFRSTFLDGIAAGKITLAFRRWRRPTVKAGGRLRTAVGELAIEAVDQIEESAITEEDARRAGYSSREALFADLREGPEPIHRIRFHLQGPDRRVALRRQASLTRDEAEELRTRLARLDRASANGPWTRAVLELIAKRPAVRAADLAASLGRDTPSFKLDVRKLKNLGLTESLETGYRISPRGKAALKVLEVPQD